MPYIIFTSVISIVVALLALQNGAATSVNFIFWKFEIPLICVILVAFLAGALVSSVVLVYTKFRHFLTNHRNNNEIKKLNKQVDDLQKNIALLTEPVKTVNVKAEKAEEAQVKPAKAETKAETKAEAKPEVKPEVKVENKLEEEGVAGI